MQEVGMNIEVGFDPSGLTSGLTKAESKLQSFGSAANKMATNISNTDVAFKKMATGSNSAAFALTNVGRVAQDLPFGFIGIQNNLNPLLESFQRLKAETGSGVGALKALGSSLMGAGGLGLALSAVSAAILIYQNGIAGFNSKTKEAADSAKKYKDELSGIFSDVGKEAGDVLSLISVLRNETETRERKLAVIKELNKINPEIFNGLKAEESAVLGVDAAYKKYLANLKNIVTAKILQKQLDEQLIKLVELEGAAKTKGEKGNKALLDFYTNLGESTKTASRRTGDLAVNFSKSLDPIIATKGRIEELVKALGEFSQVVDVPKNAIKAAVEKVEKEVKRRDYSPAIGLHIKTSDEILQELNKVQKDITDALGKNPIIIKGRIDIQNSDKEGEGLRNARAFAKSIEDANIAASQSVMSIWNDAFAAVGESIGNALGTGGNVIQAAFGALFNVIGNGLKTLGKAMIAIGTAKSGVEKFNLVPGIGTVIAGVAAVALGALLQSQVPKFAVGTQNFAGGMAIVGERGPELAYLPKGSGVIPNDKLSNINGGSSQVIIPDIRLRGQDLIIAFKRASQSNNRAF